MSTDRVSYEPKTGPGLLRFDLGELVLTEKLEPATLALPTTLGQNTEIILKGTLRWPKETGKIHVIELEFYQPRNGVDVGLAGAMAVEVNEKNGVHHFETTLSKTPIDFMGKCKVRLVAHTVQFDFDPQKGIPAIETPVTIGVAEVEIR